MMNNSEGKKLVPKIAEQLIIELFAGQTIQTEEIRTAVEEAHTKRGGLPHTSKYHPVQTALRNLRIAGKVENTSLGYWKIYITEDTSTEPTIIRSLDDFIKWAKKLDEGKFAFRGVRNEEYTIKATSLLRPTGNKRSDETESDFVKFLHINKDLIREAKQRGYNKKDQTELSDLDILAELQHFGAATCLIDFSYNAQVALWFACESVTNRKKKDNTKDSEVPEKPVNGKVFAVKYKPPRSQGLPLVKEISPDFLDDGEDQEDKKKIDFYLKEDKDSPLYCLIPKFQNQRIIAQQSVFLFGKSEFKEDEVCIIAGECKENIRIELAKVSGITKDRLFPDLEGFASVNSKDSPYAVSTFSAYKDQGDRNYNNEKYTDAIEDYSMAIDIEPDNAEVYYLRGKVYVNLEDEEKALDDFNEAIVLNLKSAAVFFNRGCLYKKRERYEDALNDLDIAIELDTDNAIAYCIRGQIRYQLRQYITAEEDFERATNLDPNYGEAFFYRGRTQYNNRNYETSLEYLNDAINLEFEDVRAYCLRGVVKSRLKDYVPAIIDFEKAIELKPDDINSVYYGAEAKVFQQNYSEARQDLKFASELAEQQDNKILQDMIDDLLIEIDVRSDGESKDE